MKVLDTDIKDVKIIEFKVFGDHRGFFMETYNKDVFHNAGITEEFVQDNHSYSKIKGTLRGLHFQNHPKAQSKLIRCTRGRMLDVAVDLRKGSPTYKKWVAVELSAENKRALFIPKGFAHGFLTLTEDVEVQYKVDELYSKEHDRSILYNDPDLQVKWGVIDPVLSEKDIHAPLLSDSDVNFVYEEVL
jgi:dTDP-4-dehydrorhamnose 3,5-epimerase